MTSVDYRGGYGGSGGFVKSADLQRGNYSIVVGGGGFTDADGGATQVYREGDLALTASGGICGGSGGSGGDGFYEKRERDNSTSGKNYKGGSGYSGIAYIIWPKS